MPVRTHFALVTLLASTLAVGCGSATDDLEPGTASLSWTVGARGCDASGVESIRIQTEDGLGETLQWVAACADGAIDLGDLRPGTYVFGVEGLAADGGSQYVGVSEPTDVRAGGQVAVERVHLTSRPADVRVEWTFGGPLCSHVGVTHVELLAVDMDGNIEDEVIVACDDGAGQLILPPRSYDIVVSGQDLDGDEAYLSIVTVDLKAGDEVTERVELVAVD